MILKIISFAILAVGLFVLELFGGDLEYHADKKEITWVQDYFIPVTRAGEKLFKHETFTMIDPFKESEEHHSNEQQDFLPSTTYVRRRRLRRLSA